jgi:hypothetical protein
VAIAWATLRQGGWGSLGAWMAEVVRGLWALVKTRPLVASLILVAVLVLSGAFRAAARRVRVWLSCRRRAAPSAAEARLPSELAALLRRVEQLWSRRGHPRPPTRGLLEHMDGLPRDGLTSAERDVSAAVVESYYRASFGGEPPSMDTLTRLAAGVAALR